jgi:hypothetical protein
MINLKIINDSKINIIKIFKSGVTEPTSALKTTDHNCEYYFIESEKRCVSFCSSGYFADYKEFKCSKCDSSCVECDGPYRTNCTKCNQEQFLARETHECLNDCPLSKGYLISKYFSHLFETK